MNKINLKLSITEQAPYLQVKEFCEFAIKQGYNVIVSDNGNFIFEKDTEAEAPVEDVFLSKEEMEK